MEYIRSDMCYVLAQTSEIFAFLMMACGSFKVLVRDRSLDSDLLIIMPAISRVKYVKVDKQTPNNINIAVLFNQALSA